MHYYEKMIILQRNDTCIQKDTRPGCLELTLLINDTKVTETSY